MRGRRRGDFPVAQKTATGMSPLRSSWRSRPAQSPAEELINAINKGDEKRAIRATVQLPFRRGLGVNERARTDGMTVLAYASVRGHLKAMRLLLEHRANLDPAQDSSKH